ncbi:MAG TPA: molybdopterin molybdotransferase MoeA [Steroidobacteraceae bacterium]|nr:molybdopterin molybdotransferase MoeA [Steroidobacteraceae bacterium]
MTDDVALPTPAAAEALIRAQVQSLPIESRPLASLSGAVLAQSVRSERDQPPFDRVTMDGVALASQAWRAGQRRFPIVGTAAAGSPPLRLEDPGACIEAMTGAVLPHGCDCVVPSERIAVEDGVAEVDERTPVEPFWNVHTRGLDCREGDMLLARGTVLGAPELAVLASAGLPRAEVHADPRIVIVATGDELVAPDEPIEAWQVRRCNSQALRGALNLRGFHRVAEDHLPDDHSVLASRVATHLATHDVIILTGGVSMGRFDHVPSVLRELGVTEVFHRIAQRPGKPLWFGIGPAGQTVLGLPGNPVSALVCLLRYALPALYAMLGARPRAVEHVPLGAAFTVRPPLWFFLPVQVEHSPTLGVVAMPRPTRGSGDFISLLGTDGFVELPPGPRELPAGYIAPLYRW